MSDRVDPQSSSWSVAPSTYLTNRDVPYAKSDTPESVYITMRDGCRLAADIYLPQAGTQAVGTGATFPSVLIFTPYYRRFRTDGTIAEPAPAAARYRDLFVPRGYAVVVVDVRGTGASFGTRDALRSPTEREDFGEVAQWVCEQSWSNGITGSTGISYVGAAACFLASTGHPSVKAIAPLFSMSDIYSEQLFPGGLLAKIWTENYDALMLAMDQDRRDLMKNFSYYTDPGLQGPHPVDDDSNGQQMGAALLEHRGNFSLNDASPEFTFRGEGMLYDPSFTLGVCSPYFYLDKIAPEVPIYSISGWYDGAGYANGAITRFLTRPGENDRLLLGPWDHGARTNGSPWRGAVTPEFDLMADVLRFFDEHLMGRNTGIREEAPIHYFDVHAEQWHAAQTWPPVKTEETWYLGENSLAKRASQAGTTRYQTDFTTNTGRNTRSERLGAKNIVDYYPDWKQNQAGMASFTSAPLEAPLSFAGHVIATLRMRVSEPDASIFVYLSEVEADGQVRYITEGFLRALHRKVSPCPADYVTTWPFRSYAREDAAPLEKGALTEFVIPLLPTSWTLSAGSALRVSIAGADRAHYAAHPYGRPPVFDISWGTAEGSAISIPVRT